MSILLQLTLVYITTTYCLIPDMLGVVCVYLRMPCHACRVDGSGAGAGLWRCDVSIHAGLTHAGTVVVALTRLLCVQAV